jgi:hypothetical protein
VKDSYISTAIERSNHTISFKQSLPTSTVMRLVLCFLLSIVVALHSAVDAAPGKERRSASNVLTPDFMASVQKIVDAEGIPGLTLAIVNKTGPAELGAWGIKSENGTKMTADVR